MEDNDKIRKALHKIVDEAVKEAQNQLNIGNIHLELSKIVKSGEGAIVVREDFIQENLKIAKERQMRERN